MSTEHALKECCSPKDEGINLGKLSLQKFQKHFQQDQRQWIKSKEVYHESEVVEEADIRNLVGLVRFYWYRQMLQTKIISSRHSITTRQTLSVSEIPFVKQSES